MAKKYREVYKLKACWSEEWTEVSKEVFIVAERAAGFYPKMASDDPGYDTTCATGGFMGHGVQGRIEYIEEANG